ncbi:MAG TPA: serine/threonine-protein kinase [Blastocatellia bacterium]|nr:serine/threonine-protein kinase [Blastocatellia bacterium]
MTPERYRQIDQFADAALELGVEERAAFLDRACSGDGELRCQVERLLSAHEHEAGFLSTPALEAIAQEMAAAQTRSLIGRQLGHYRILSLLGAGGMCEVYLAEDAILGRKVALKLLPVEFTRDQDRLLRFKQEARAASSLNHPNIITIYEIGEIDGIHFIATEFIDGQTLRQRSAQGRLELFAALDIGIQTAAALSAAHEAGIAHRDVKPENLMLRPDGYLKVLDFGSSKLTERWTPGGSSNASMMTGVRTAPGIVMGTINYMSPEQIRGVEVDVRSDIFTLGVVLYEMLTGAKPFTGATTADVIAAILDKEPAPLSPGTPKELERIVSRALRKDRENRYQTVQDLLLDLKSLKQELELEARLERIRRSSGVAASGAQVLGYLKLMVKRHKHAAIVTLAALIVTAAALVFYFKWFARPD